MLLDRDQDSAGAFRVASFLRGGQMSNRVRPGDMLLAMDVFSKK